MYKRLHHSLSAVPSLVSCLNLRGPSLLSLMLPQPLFGLSLCLPVSPQPLSEPSYNAAWGNSWLVAASNSRLQHQCKNFKDFSSWCQKSPKNSSNLMTLVLCPSGVLGANSSCAQAWHNMYPIPWLDVSTASRKLQVIQGKTRSGELSKAVFKVTIAICWSLPQWNSTPCLAR